MCINQCWWSLQCIRVRSTKVGNHVIRKMRNSKRSAIRPGTKLDILDLLFTPLPQFLLQLRINCDPIRKRDPSPASEILLRERHQSRYMVDKYGGRDTHLAIEFAGSGRSAGIQRGDRPVCDRICRHPSNTLDEPGGMTREIRIDGPWVQCNGHYAFTAVLPSEFV